MSVNKAGACGAGGVEAEGDARREQRVSRGVAPLLPRRDGGLLRFRDRARGAVARSLRLLGLLKANEHRARILTGEKIRF